MRLDSAIGAITARLARGDTGVGQKGIDNKERSLSPQGIGAAGSRATVRRMISTSWGCCRSSAVSIEHVTSMDEHAFWSNRMSRLQQGPDADMIAQAGKHAARWQVTLPPQTRGCTRQAGGAPMESAPPVPSAVAQQTGNRQPCPPRCAKLWSCRSPQRRLVGADLADSTTLGQQLAQNDTKTTSGRRRHCV